MLGRLNEEKTGVLARLLSAGRATIQQVARPPLHILPPLTLARQQKERVASLKCRQCGAGPPFAVASPGTVDAELYTALAKAVGHGIYLAITDHIISMQVKQLNRMEKC